MLDDAVLDQLFRAARSTHAFTSQPVTDELLRQLYELLKWGPTAWNSQPGR
jgi:3-hydroxypropanoate dehydrogenase